MPQHDDGLVHVETQTGKARLRRDGRAELVFDQLHHLPQLPKQFQSIPHEALQAFTRKRYQLPKSGDPEHIPRLNIAILITGSRGDVQPFIALAKALQSAPYHHRVRIGTHPIFRNFVKENGIEFYPIGGDPERLMSYMVRNPGVLPSLASIKAGDIGARKAELEEMLVGAWNACIESADPGDPEADTKTVFVADAIISNPPTYASLHIAERLRIPLHYMFTMPWSPTGAFPHPLAQLDSSRTDAARANHMSYVQMELLTWVGLADIVNRFRTHTLLLDPINPTWASYLLSHLNVPFTYCWSPALIPKPADWGPQISISGFFFLEKATSFTPDPDLQAFLDAGPPPVYIGFGSIVIDQPEAFIKLIMEAVEKAGVRALVSKGWINISAEKVPDNIFLLGNVPHDWLFPRASAVVHHGGAGTCAIGLKLGRPTVVVPFFGDQFWWAGIVSRAGAGPPAVPYKQLTAEKLANNITAALQPEIQAKAQEIADKMKNEDGVNTAARQFHELQQLTDFACMLCPERVAVYRVKRTDIGLSALAAAALIGAKRLHPKDLKLIQHKRWYVEEGPPGPLSGALGALSSGAMSAVIDVQDAKRSLTIRKELSKSSKPGQDETDVEKQQLEREKQHVETPSKPPLPESRARIGGRLVKNLTIDGLRTPVAFFYNIANGCHNAPAIVFNDPTVRVRDEIVGLKSGFKVSGKEVVFGLCDSVTNLFALPYIEGMKASNSKGGRVLGGIKGFAKSVAGIPCHLGAAVFGIPGYTLKGLEQQLRRYHKRDDDINYKSVMADFQPAEESGSKPDWERLRTEWGHIAVGKPIAQRRIWQGIDDIHAASPEVKAEIVKKYDSLERAQ